MNIPAPTPLELAQLAAPVYASMLEVSASDDNPARPDYKSLMGEAIEHAGQLYRAAAKCAGEIATTIAEGDRS